MNQLSQTRVQIEERLEQWRPFVQGRKFLWLTVPPWSGVWTRQNHFVLRLVKLGAEVLYVERPCPLSQVIRQRSFSLLFTKPKIRSIVPNLDVLTLPPVVPGALHSNLIANLRGRQIGQFISAELQKRQWQNYICWTRVPSSVHIFPSLHPSPTNTVYDVTDDYGAFTPQYRERVDGWEAELLARADLVLTTSERLIPSRKKINPHIHHVPNGVDFNLFSSVGNPGLVPHPVVASIPKPVIGFVGLVADWVDLNIIAALGKRWPGHIIMVGPIKPSLRDAVKKIAGVKWTGFIEDRRDLPRYIQGMDVCTIPFHVNELTMDMNPLKIWEYFATGKPIVSE